MQTTILSPSLHSMTVLEMLIPGISYKTRYRVWTWDMMYRPEERALMVTMPYSDN